MNVSCGESAGNEVNSPGEMRMGKAAAGPRSARFLQSAGPFVGRDVTWLAGAKTENDTVLTQLRATRNAMMSATARCSLQFLVDLWRNRYKRSLMRVEMNFLSVQYKYAGVASEG